LIDLIQSDFKHCLAQQQHECRYQLPCKLYKNYHAIKLKGNIKDPYSKDKTITGNKETQMTGQHDPLVSKLKLYTS